MKRNIIALIITLFTLPAMAVEMPTPTEAKKVLDFYYQGQGQGIVLVDTILCKEIHKEGDNKNDCADVISDATVVKGDKVNLWMAYLVPNKEEKQSIIIQFEQNGVTRMVKNLQVSGSVRYRTWRKVSFNKAGNWTAKIFHESGDDTKLLDTVNITVTEAMPETAPVQ